MADKRQNVPKNNADVLKNVPKSALQELILSMIQDDPSVSRTKIAAAAGVSVKTVGREIAKMPYLHHVGPLNGGRWEVE